jgi:hypothetical protein
LVAKGVGVRITLAQAAWQALYVVLQLIIAGGATAAATVLK